MTNEAQVATELAHANHLMADAVCHLGQAESGPLADGADSMADAIRCLISAVKRLSTTPAATPPEPEVPVDPWIKTHSATSSNNIKALVPPPESAEQSCAAMQGLRDAALAEVKRLRESLDVANVGRDAAIDEAFEWRDKYETAFAKAERLKKQVEKFKRAAEIMFDAIGDSVDQSLRKSDRHKTFVAESWRWQELRAAYLFSKIPSTPVQPAGEA